MNVQLIYTTVMLMPSAPIQTVHFTARVKSVTLAMESTAQVSNNGKVNKISLFHGSLNLVLPFIFINFKVSFDLEFDRCKTGRNSTFPRPRENLP